MFDFHGKKALVTGASGGIGSVLAADLAAAGALVAVHCSRQREAADALVQRITAAGGAAFAVQADLRSVAAIGELLRTVGAEFERRTGDSRFDFLVNNAGAGVTAALPEMTEAAFDDTSDLMFKGTFFLTQQACGRLHDGGRILNVSSIAANSAQPYQAVYAAAKSAVNHLTLSFAQHLGPRGITVNAVSPGATATPLIAGLRARPGFDEAVARNTALGRFGQPQDIADAMLLLLSPQAGWITGQVIDVSGGTRL